MKFNVNFSEGTYQAIGDLARDLDASMADVIRDALSLYSWVAKEYSHGNRLLVQRDDDVTELVITGLEPLQHTERRRQEVIPQTVDSAAAPLQVGRRRRGPASVEG